MAKSSLRPHIQVDEINQTSDEDRRARLILTLASTIRELLPTETTVLDVSRLDWCKLGDGEVYTSIKNALDARNGGRHANIRDALIAEVAIANGYGLVTADTTLLMSREITAVRSFTLRSNRPLHLTAPGPAHAWLSRLGVSCSRVPQVSGTALYARLAACHHDYRSQHFSAEPLL
jgi:predicted nucleic acid-binding protein